MMLSILLHITNEGYDLIDSLEAIKDLELVVIDPIQSFCSAPNSMIMKSDSFEFLLSNDSH